MWTCGDARARMRSRSSSRSRSGGRSPTGSTMVPSCRVGGNQLRQGVIAPCRSGAGVAGGTDVGVQRSELEFSDVKDVRTPRPGPSLLSLAASHDSVPSVGAAGLGDDRPLAVGWSIGIDDDPVVGPAQLMCPRRVREHRGVVPIGSCGVENRQPTGMCRVQASGCDCRQLTCCRTPPVLAVDVE